MNDFSFDPVTGLLDTSAYPTQPTTEAGARQQFMDLFNQLKTFMNTDIKTELGTKANKNAMVTTVTRAANIVGTQTITLGFQPRLVKIRAFFTGTNYMNYDSDCSFDGTNYSGLAKYGNGLVAPLLITGGVVYLGDGASASNVATCAFTPTGITLTWAATNTLPAGNIIMKIEAV